MMTTKSHEGLFRKIPREDLMITQKTNQSLPQDVYLQVGLKSHLLRTGLELVVAPTSINEQSIEQFLVQCRNDYHALAIYCLDGKRPLNQLVSYITYYVLGLRILMRTFSNNGFTFLTKKMENIFG